MRWWVVLVGVALFPSLGWALDLSVGRLDVESQSQVSYYNVKGDTDKALVEEGVKYLEEIGLLFSAQDEVSGLSIESSLRLRITDDSQYEINDRRLYITEGYMRLFNEDMEIVAGDFGEDFSRYTFSSSLLGVKGKFSLGKTKITLLGGSNRDEDLDGYLRYAGGGRLEFGFKGIDFGLSLITSSLDSASIKDYAPVPDEDNTVLGLSFSTNITDSFLLAGEFARSVYNSDDDDPSQEDKYDSAYYLNGVFSLSWMNIRVEAERVDPDFYSVYGSASSDLQRYSVGLELYPKDNLSTYITYEFSHNRVAKNSDAEKRDYMQMLSLGLGYLPFYQAQGSLSTLTFNLQCDVNQAYDDRPQKELDNSEFRLNLSASQSIGNWGYNLGVIFSRSWDSVDSSTNYNDIQPYIGLSWTGSNADWNYGMNTNLSLSRQSLVNSDEVNKTWRWEIGFNLGNIPAKLNLNACFSVEDNENEGSYSPEDNILYSYSLGLDKVIIERDNLQGSLSLEFRRNDYNSDGTDDYQEDVLSVKFNLRF